MEQAFPTRGYSNNVKENVVVSPQKYISSNSNGARGANSHSGESSYKSPT